jgi:hypothetical protein
MAAFLLRAFDLTARGCVDAVRATLYPPVIIGSPIFEKMGHPAGKPFDNRTLSGMGHPEKKYATSKRCAGLDTPSVQKSAVCGGN